MFNRLIKTWLIIQVVVWLTRKSKYRVINLNNLDFYNDCLANRRLGMSFWWFSGWKKDILDDQRPEFRNYLSHLRVFLFIRADSVDKLVSVLLTGLCPADD